jgi:hypothetical protein
MPFLAIKNVPSACHFADRTLEIISYLLQVGVAFRQFSEGFVQAKAGAQVRFGLLKVPQHSVVTSEIVIINRFVQKRRRPVQQGLFCFRGPPKLVKAERRMHIAKRLVRIRGAKPQTQPESVFPILFSQKDVDSHSQDLQAILMFRIELIQLCERVVEHPEFRVTFRDADYLFEGHRS